MGAGRFNEMEIDAIGEIMNISLGSSATALSTMLGTKVNITTPIVKIQSRTEFEFRELEPAIGVEISYHCADIVIRCYVYLLLHITASNRFGVTYQAGNTGHSIDKIFTAAVVCH